MWPAGWVIEKYASALHRGREFDKEELLSHWGVSPNYASVSLHRMREHLLVDRVGRARYSLVPPEKWVSLSLLSAQHPEISGALCGLLRDLVNQTETLVFYGSRALGVCDELSDWDFLVIASSPGIKARMLAKLGSIREGYPLFRPEILDLEGFRTCLRKALVFLKVVEREGKVIFDSGLMGMVRASRVEPVHIAYELLGAKKNILLGISLLKRGKSGLACYRVVMGVRLTLLADLACRGVFSGEEVGREFARRFSEFEEMGKAYRMMKAGKKAEVDALKLDGLIDEAISTWEEVREKAMVWGKKTK